jgi:Txe/YoeB family toxin of Txe-Axe toxin-antitoxin module
MKPSKVVFASRQLEQAYELLKEEDWLKKAITSAVHMMRKNAFAGVQIQKKLFPKEYVRKYGITNLWKYNLPHGWRLIYTITAKNEVELISAILDWLPHKEYENKFNY